MFSLVAAVSGLFSLTQVGGALNKITEQRVPEALSWFELSRQVESVVRAAPALLVVKTDRARIEASKEISSQIAQIEPFLKQNGSYEPKNEKEAKDEVVKLFAEMTENLVSLNELVKKRLSIVSLVNKRIRDLSRANHVAKRMLSPSERILAAQMADWRRYRETAEANQVLDEKADLVISIIGLIPQQRAALLVDSIHNNLLKIADADTSERIDVLKFPLKKSLEELYEVSLTVSQRTKRRLAKQVAILEDLTEGPNSLSLVKKNELTVIGQGEDLLAVNVRLCKFLTNRVNYLVNSANSDIENANLQAKAIRALNRNVLIGIAALSFISSILIVWPYAGRNLIARLSSLRESMRAIAGGDLRASVPELGSDDEIARMAWIDYESSLYRVMYWEEHMGPGGGYPVFESFQPLRELSFGLESDNSRHLTFVMDDGPNQKLYYLRQPATGPDLIDFMIVSDGVHCPALEVWGDNAHIVFESDIMGSSWLFHVTGTSAGLGPMQDLMSGTNSREADLARGNGGLVLVFVRDLWVPGWREICYQMYNGASWDSPVPLYFGVSIFSPSVAWDANNRTLFSWILDNTGSDPLLHTCLMEWGVPGPVRWRDSDGIIYATTVDSPGGGVFHMLSQESETGMPMKMYLRTGDGEAFYPKVQINSSTDVDKPLFAVEYGTGRTVAWWEEYNETAHPFHFVKCLYDISGVPDMAPLAEANMLVYPNPFNPSTTVTFALPEAGRIQLAVYELGGRLVRTLAEGSFGVGPQQVPWDGRDDQGNPMASGVYFSKLTLPGGKGEMIQKMALIR